ncbi:unnamed protein product [Musa acuminata var. zebrina]
MNRVHNTNKISDSAKKGRERQRKSAKTLTAYQPPPPPPPPRRRRRWRSQLDRARGTRVRS